MLFLRGSAISTCSYIFFNVDCILTILSADNKVWGYSNSKYTPNGNKPGYSEYNGIPRLTCTDMRGKNLTC